MQAHALYSRKLAERWTDYMAKNGNHEDKLMAEMFNTPTALHRWRTKVYSLPLESPEAIDERLSVIDRVLGYSDLDLEKEAAIASMSVWLLQVSSNEELATRLAVLVSKHSKVFLRQRGSLGIPIHSDDVKFDMEYFKRADKISYEIFKRVYEDNEVAQLVRTMSGMVAVAENQKNLDRLTKSAYHEWSKARIELDLAVLEKLLNRKAPERSAEDIARDQIAIISNLRTFVISPVAHALWIKTLRTIPQGSSLTKQAEELISEFESETIRARDLAALYNIHATLEMKLEEMDDLLMQMVTPKFDGNTMSVEI
jgi:hypothetical protein